MGRDGRGRAGQYADGVKKGMGIEWEMERGWDGK